MFKFLNKFRKPTIKAQLIDKGTKVKVDLRNINKRQQIVALHIIVKEVAKGMNMDHGYVLNRLHDIERDMKRAKKAEEKEVRKQIYGNKK